MFGCLGRLVVLVVLLAAGVGAYVTRSRWEPTVRERLGIRPRRVSSATWTPITAEGAARIRSALESLRRPSGPAFVSVQPGDLVAYAIEPVLQRLATDSAPPAARSAQNMLTVRGAVSMSDIGGAAALGALAGVLEGTQRIELTGRVEVPQPGRAVFIVTRIALGDLTLPSAVIGRVVQQIAPRTDKTQVEEGIALKLPAEVADIRFTIGRVTLYKGGQ